MKSLDKSFNRFHMLAFCLGTVICHSALAEPVHIEIDNGRTQEHGAGISVGKGQECFVVAPLHVVEFARSIVITDRKGRSAKAARYQAPDGVDAVLLKLESDHSLDCPEDWDDGSTGESTLEEIDFLVSKKVKQRGIQRRRFFLGGETSTTISLQPYSPTLADRLVEGDSGSSLYAENRLVGMIVSVDTASGAGHAIKQSQLHALFGTLVLEQSVKHAVINPVYYQNREDRYATDGVKSFIDERTPFDIVELDPGMAASNAENFRRNITPKYPDKADYIISSTILENRSRNEANPNYKSSAAKESNFGKQMLNSLGNRSVRYIYVSNIDVEVQFLLPKEGRQFTHIERLEYKVPLKEGVDKRQLGVDLAIRAAVDAVHAAMLKYGLPVIPEEKAEDTSILGRLFKKGDKD